MVKGHSGRTYPTPDGAPRTFLVLVTATAVRSVVFCAAASSVNALHMYAPLTVSANCYVPRWLSFISAISVYNTPRNPFQMRFLPNPGEGGVLISCIALVFRPLTLASLLRRDG